MKGLRSTDFTLDQLKRFYRGKVRDVYFLENDLMVAVATDRISAFDCILPEPIPFKGQVLNQIAAYFLQRTTDIIPNWLAAVPDPNATIGHRCNPIKVEMVIRGYLVGHAWREYKAGRRTLSGVDMPEGMKENEAFPQPIITPATKSEEGHDEDISREEILNRGLVSESIYNQMEKTTYALYERGSKMARKQGLILVDTKYEFGIKDGELHLIDEIHTPDSSRYFYAEEYEERLSKGERQRQLSKEFVREWLMEQGFAGKEGQEMPQMPRAFIDKVSERYIELYEKLTGQSFEPAPQNQIEERILRNVNKALRSFGTQGPST